MGGLAKGVCVVIALGAPLAARARSYDTGGIQLTFGTRVGLQTRSNATLDPVAPRTDRYCHGRFVDGPADRNPQPAFSL